MVWRWVYLAIAFVALAVPVPAVAKSPGVNVVAKGACVVQGGIHTQDGKTLAAWDMWQEIFLTSWPTWLQPHTHRGAECIMNVYGVTGWWFEQGGATPGAAPTM